MLNHASYRDASPFLKENTGAVHVMKERTYIYIYTHIDYVNWSSSRNKQEAQDYLDLVFG